MGGRLTKVTYIGRVNLNTVFFFTFSRVRKMDTVWVR